MVGLFPGPLALQIGLDMPNQVIATEQGLPSPASLCPYSENT